MINGTNGNDSLQGGGGDDTINGGNGNDSLQGGNSNDVLNGGSDNDYLHGGDGNDVLQGGTGNDDLNGGDGDDFLSGGTGNDVMTGGGGADTYDYHAGDGADIVTTFDSDDKLQVTGYAAPLSITQVGNDVVVEFSAEDRITFTNTTIDMVTPGLEYVDPRNFIYGTEGQDENLMGTPQQDVLYGLAGDDTLFGLAQDDLIDGGDGNDTANYRYAGSGVTVSLLATGAQNTGGAGSDTLVGIENLTGSDFNDTLTGNIDSNVLTGGAGNDVLDGRGGADTMIGGAGHDLYYVDDSNDVIVENAGEGQDRVLAKADFTLAAGVEVETLGALNQLSTTPLNFTGNEFDQSIVGNAGDNILTGGGGNDDLNGLGGLNTMIGGTGDDIYRVRSGDVIVETAGEGDDMIRAYTSYTLESGVSVETIATKNGYSTEALDLAGNEFNQTIVANNGANVLSGMGGSDNLLGLEGNDTLIGGAGADTLRGGLGNDSFVFQSASDSTVGAMDRIIDFTAGDSIDLAQIDANSGVADDQAFDFVGSAAFSGTAGELRYEASAENTFVYGDTNGDGSADFVIQLAGSHALTLGDFAF
jgi:Ca2+-binding RTX toxin-like protein